MTISLSGIAQFGVDNILLGTRTRSKVEFLVMKTLRDKVFPQASRDAASIPNRPAMFNMLSLKALPELQVELTEAEVEALVKALESHEQNENGPGVSVEAGSWFYPLLDSLKEKP